MDQIRYQDKRIAVVGAGGVGGYLAGMLGQVCPRLTIVARGKRAEIIRERGLVLHSEYHGERITRPECVTTLEELKPQDYIFVCVKNYSLEDVCRVLKNAVTDDTVIIPVMNGVNPGERVRELLGTGTVVESLIYIVSFANPDGSITQQGKFASIRIGIQNATEDERKKVGEVASILEAAGLDFAAADDIQAEIWRKYILNCAYNVETAYYDNTIGQLRDEKAKSKEYEDLVWEAYAVARAKDVHVTEEQMREIIDKFYHEYGYEATSSLQRDFQQGKPSEVETFSGYLVKEAKRLGISVPVSEKMYLGLIERASGKGV